MKPYRLVGRLVTAILKLSSLQNIGRVYNSMGEAQKALENFNCLCTSDGR